MTTEYRVGVRIEGDSKQLQQASQGGERSLEQLEGAAKRAALAQNGLTISTAQYQAAMRGLPAQITDIVTGLASGQSVFTVAIQQGGQIKDQFGGMGNILTMVRGAVSGTTLAMGGLAAVSGVLALAANKGADEQRSFALALATTNNAAGTTVEKMADAARAVGEVEGTTGSAAAAIAQLASSGRVAGRDLPAFAETALRAQRLLGRGVEDTVKLFAELGRDPVAASARLNETTNYLTASVLRQIQALDQRGQRAAAAALAQDEFNKAQQRVLDDTEKRLGTLERTWQAIERAAKKGWDAILNVGREDTLQQRLDSVNAALSAPIRRDANQAQAAARRAALEEQKAALEEQIRLQSQAAARAGENAQAEQAKIRSLLDKKSIGGRNDTGRPYIPGEFQVLDARDGMVLAAAREKAQSQIDGFYADVERKAEERNKQRVDQEATFLQQLVDENARAAAQLLGEDRTRGEAQIALERDIARRRVMEMDISGPARAQALAEIDSRAQLASAALDRRLQQASDAAAAQAGQSFYQDTRTALLNAFRDTRNPAEAFINGFAAALYTRVTASLADAMANGLVGQDGQGGLLGGLVRAGLQWAFGDTMTVDTSGAGTVVPSDDRPRGGRAGGGGVSAYGDYWVGEQGPELLRMGSRSGWVVPNQALGGGGASEVKLTLVNQSGTPLQATAGDRSSNGDMLVVLTALEAGLADRVSNGEGSLYGAVRGRFGLRDTFASA